MLQVLSLLWSWLPRIWQYARVVAELETTKGQLAEAQAAFRSAYEANKKLLAELTAAKQQAAQPIAFTSETWVSM